MEFVSINSIGFIICFILTVVFWMRYFDICKRNLTLKEQRFRSSEEEEYMVLMYKLKKEMFWCATISTICLLVVFLVTVVRFIRVILI